MYTRYDSLHDELAAPLGFGHPHTDCTSVKLAFASRSPPTIM